MKIILEAVSETDRDESVREAANGRGYTLRNRVSKSERHSGVFKKLNVDRYVELRNPTERHCFTSLDGVHSYLAGHGAPSLSYLEQALPAGCLESQAYRSAFMDP